ncbi:MAG: hypothetical protein ACR2G7_05485 [Acidimicrobiales bacterium]
MNRHRLARLLAVGRVVVGSTLVVVPGMATGLVGPPGAEPAVKVLTRAAGIRDLLLGWRTVQALDADRPVRALLHDGAMADAVDLGAVLVAWGHLPHRARLMVLTAATGAVAMGWRLAQLLD